MRRSLVLLGAAALTLVAYPARADWSVRRAASDPRASEALLEALLRTPDDGGALRRLLAHGGGKAGRLRLAARCDLRAKETQQLACGHLYREAGRPEIALARYAAVAATEPRAHRAAGALLLRLGRADEALASLLAAHALPGAADRLPLLELVLSASTQARTPSLEERRRLAEAVAQELLALQPGNRTLERRTAEALATVGAHATAARIVSDLAAATGDPRGRSPLLFRAAELFEAADQPAPALAALEQALAIMPASDSRRREAHERIVSIERQRERLAQLAARWSAWPEARRDAATEELLGRILDELGDSSTAQLHLERAVRLDPRALGPRRLLIRMHTRRGDEESAIAELRRLTAATGDDARVALELAERLFARPGGGKEASALAKNVGRRHRDANTHAALAALYQRWGDKAQALAEASLLVRLEPNEPEHLIALGELYDQRGDKALALRTWRQLARGPKPPLPQALRLADVLAEHDAAGEALSLLERAAHEHPADPAVERRLADVLDRLRRGNEAETIYRRILEQAVTRDDATLVRDAGERWLALALRQGTIGALLGAFTTLAEEPNTAARVELALLVARARVREKRGLEAERMLRRIVAVAPRETDRAHALEALAELLGSQSGARALELLVTAAELDPARAPLLYGKASRRAAELYRDDEALTYAERAVSLGALEPDAHERLGSVLEPRDPRRALAAYDRAIELDGGRDRLRLRAAEVALRLGDDEGAAGRYRALLARARDEQSLDEAARRAVVVHELTGQLGALEREIAPRASSGDGPPALRRLLVDLERRYVPELASRADAGDAGARTELERVSAHALAPLLDSVVEGDRDERRAAVILLGQLGARGAAPLLLRLALGATPRRGSEAPPIELRAAAADAAAWLVADEHLAQVLPLTLDPEQRVRAAATLALVRIATAPPPRTFDRPGRPKAPRNSTIDRALGALLPRVSDDHDRIAATACLGLVHAPRSSPIWSAVSARAADRGRPLAARACGIALAERLERPHPDGADELVLTLQRRLEQAREGAASTNDVPSLHEVLPPLLTAGLARALLATDDPAAIERALVAILSDPVLRRSFAGPAPDTSPAPALRRTGSGSLDLIGAIAAREAAPATSPSVSHRTMLRNAMLRLLEGPAVELVLSDLAGPRPVLPRLLAGRPSAALASAAGGGSDEASARAELLDAALAPLTAALSPLRAAQPAPTRIAAAVRPLALALLVERPAGLDAVAAALFRPLDRHEALVALALPTAAEPGAELVARLSPFLRAAMAASDWRDRHAALAAARRHAQLATVLSIEIAGLRDDSNGIVAHAARVSPGALGAPGADRAPSPAVPSSPPSTGADRSR